MYAKFFKRLIDFILALMGIVILSPILIVLIALGAIFMGQSFLYAGTPWEE